MKHPTVADLFEYLMQLPQDARVVLTEADVDEPCEFVALDVALEQLCGE